MPTQNFKVGEMLNKRTRNSKTWINFDGSYTTEIHSSLVHFEDEHGNLQNINTDLIDETELDLFDLPVSKHAKNMIAFERAKVKEAKRNRNFNHDNFDFQAPLLPFSVQIPRNIKKGYSVGQNGQYIRFVPQNTSPSKGYVDREKRNKIHYQDAWNDADVVLELNDTGIKETIILKTEKSPTTFTFEITEGKINDDGTFDEMKLLPAWLQDAEGTKRDVEQTIRREGNKTYVDLVADVSGLVYPIEVDPTVTIDPPTSWLDAYTTEYSPNSNQGTHSTMYVGGDTGYRYRSFIKMDVSSIPTGSSITSAYLNFSCPSASSISYNNYIDFYRLTSSFTETGITWNNSPSYNGTVYRSAYIGNWSSGSSTSILISQLIQEWVNGIYPNYGLMMARMANTGASVVFRSKETSETPKPSLSVTYNSPPTAPTVTTPNGGETWNSLHRVEWIGAYDPESNVSIDYENPSNYIDVSSGQDPAQTFTTGEATILNTLKFRAYYQTSPAKVNIEIWTAPGDSITTKVATISSNLEFTSPTAQIIKIKNIGLTLSKNTRYAIVWDHVSGTGKIGHHTGPKKYNNGGQLFRFNGGPWYYYGDQEMAIELTFGGLQHQIQLSTDNGTNWKDIVGLTTAGATFYDYDFINEVESSMAKIRIRAYDGTTYGPWDESDGVFTIQHNQAPTAPTNLSPVGTVHDRASVVRLSWQHNDANLDPQAQFDLQWRLQGNTTWNTVSQVTINQYYDVPANTFPKGVIEWQVRTYDQAGLSSPYSAITVFNTGDKPANPTITEPTNGAIVPISNPTIQWSSVGQTGYHLKILDINNILLWEAVKTSTNKAETIQYSLENETDYKISLAIKNGEGLWSDFVTIQILVSYTPPAKPIVTVEKGEATITLNIAHPTPVFPQPTVTNVDIYRRKQGELNWVRIAIEQLINFIDYTLASGEIYEYKVRAYGDNGTFIESDVISATIEFKGVWLFDTTNPSTIHKFKFNTEREGNWETNGALIQYAGRRLPVAEFDDTEANSVSVELMFYKHENDLPILLNLIKSKNTLCYRDGGGRKLYCQVFSVPVVDEIYGNSIGLTFNEVSYTEEV